MKYILLIAMAIVTSVNTQAQCPNDKKPVAILGHKFKIKVVTGVNSGTARIADYVEFKTMENVYSAEPVPEVLFAKDTPIYGVVTWTKHRHFPLINGKLELELEPLINWNGDKIQLAIARHGPIDRAKALDPAATEKERKRKNRPCEEDRANCITGRRNAIVAPVVTSVAAAGSAAVAAVAKDDETRFIAATAFFSIAKDMGNLLNGTDAEVSKDEILDLMISTKQVCKMPKEPKKEKALDGQ